MKLTKEESLLFNTELGADYSYSIDDHHPHIVDFGIAENDDYPYVISSDKTEYDISMFRDKLNSEESREKFEYLLEYTLSFNRNERQRNNYNSITKRCSEK